MTTELAATSTDQNGDQALSEALGGLAMAGVNHRSAPLALREKLAIPKGRCAETVRALVDKFALGEAVAISTCNRTEIYWTTQEQVSPLALFQAFPHLENESLEEMQTAIYEFQESKAIEHLFRLSCGLDSLVIGETQILHQVKKAYEHAEEEGATGCCLNPLFQRAFQVAKRVHTETQLCTHQASVPSVAIEMAEAIFDDLSNAFILVVGTGEIAQLTFDALRKKGAENFAFVSRTEERARAWAETHSSLIGTLNNLPELLPKTDILVACTATDKPVVTADMIRQAIARRRQHNRPFLALDLGVPRNIDPEVERIEQVYLRNVDDLQEIVAQNKARQEKEIVAAEAIVAESLEAYSKESRVKTASSTICEFRTKVEQIAREELDRTMARLPDLDEKEREEVVMAVHRIVGKILHAPTKTLQKASQNGHGPEAVNWVRRLFGLAGDEWHVKRRK